MIDEYIQTYYCSYDHQFINTSSVYVKITKYNNLQIYCLLSGVFRKCSFFIENIRILARF